jgi:hypothetical protein
MTCWRLTIALVASLWLQSPGPNPPGKEDRPGPRETPATLAGLYFRGDGFVNSSLQIEPDGRFVYTWWADDRGHARQEGTAEVVEGLLVLKPLKTESNRDGKITHPGYRPVRWDDRLYLLREEDFLKFCNHVNLGLEPRNANLGPYYLKMTQEQIRRDENKPDYGRADGLPGLPARWKPFLLKAPLRGKVVEVLDRDHARINLGSEDGLREGMMLFVEEDGSPADDPHVAGLSVTDVEANRCTANLVLRGTFSFRGLKRDQKVSSRIPKEIIKLTSWEFFL